jgi:hypothetical protein
VTHYRSKLCTDCQIALVLPDSFRPCATSESNAKLSRLAPYLTVRHDLQQFEAGREGTNAVSNAISHADTAHECVANRNPP